MPTVSTRQKIGLAVAGLLTASNVPSAFIPVPDEGVGPPTAVLVADTVLGLVGLVAVVVAWRTGNRAAIRVAAACVVVIAITALPAFFVDVSAVIKLLVASVVAVTIAAVVLMLTDGTRHRAVVLD